jgi:hypothetical protein
MLQGSMLQSQTVVRDPDFGGKGVPVNCFGVGPPRDRNIEVFGLQGRRTSPGKDCLKSR